MSEFMFPVDREAVIRTHRDLVAINSVNPRLETGGPGEEAVASYVSEFLTQRGFAVTTQEVEPGRHNIIGRIEGEDASRTLMFEAHMDTASVGIMTIPPFEPRLEEGRIYGRGACDTKGCLAAMLHAVALHARSGKPPVNLVMAACCDEECGQRGAEYLSHSDVTADAAVVGEPTENCVACAHKGAVRGAIRSRGRAAHSSKPELGINAIVKMAEVIRAIDTRLIPELRKRSHPLVGSPTLNIGLISGGAQVNFVPDSCTIEIDRRTIPGETSESALAEVEEIIADLQADDAELDAFLERPFAGYAPVSTPPEHPLVRAVVRACAEVADSPTAIGVPYCTDASNLVRTGMPCIVLGPGSIDQAHGAVEWIEVEQLIAAVEIYARIVPYFAAIHSV